MRLHWSPRSPFVRKVMVCAHETGLADRIECVRTVVAMTNPNRDLFPHNPIGRIPTLVLDDGSALYDSRVICEYLDSLHDGPKLFPTAPRQRWIALRRQALADGVLETLLLWRHEKMLPEAERRPVNQAAFAIKIDSALDAMTGEIVEVQGDPVGIGHVAFACALSYLDFRFAELPWRERRRPLAQWHASFAARPSMQATEAVDEP